MLSLGGSHRVFLCVAPRDFRKAHDGLCAIVRDTFRDDLFSGTYSCSTTARRTA